MNDSLSSKTDIEILRSLLAEAAKASNEVRCAQRDTDKALNRLAFIVLLVNTMIDRTQPED